MLDITNTHELCLQGFSYLSEAGARGLLNLGEKSIWTIILGKLELDRHFKWIKNHIRN